MSLSAFVLVDAILLIGNHTISEYLRRSLPTRTRSHGNSSTQWTLATTPDSLLSSSG